MRGKEGEERDESRKKQPPLKQAQGKPQAVSHKVVFTELVFFFELYFNVCTENNSPPLTIVGKTMK